MRKGGEREAYILFFPTPLPLFLPLWWLKLPYSRVLRCHTTGSLLRLLFLTELFLTALIFMAVKCNKSEGWLPYSQLLRCIYPMCKITHLQTSLYNLSAGFPPQLPLRPLYTMICFELICNCSWKEFQYPLSSAAGEKQSPPRPSSNLTNKGTEENHEDKSTWEQSHLEAS